VPSVAEKIEEKNRRREEPKKRRKEAAASFYFFKYIQSLCNKILKPLPVMPYKHLPPQFRIASLRFLSISCVSGLSWGVPSQNKWISGS